MQHIIKILSELEETGYSIGEDREDYIQLKRNMTCEQIACIAVNPTLMSHEDKGRCLLFSLYWASKLGDESIKAYFVHNLLWQLFTRDAEHWLEGYDPEVRSEAWQAIKTVYIGVLQLGDDPEWIAHNRAIRSRVLGVTGVLSH